MAAREERVKIYIGDLSRKKTFSKTITGKKISLVAEFMKILNDNMKDDVRNRHYKVAGFDFERDIGNKLSKLGDEIVLHLRTTGHLEKVDDYDDYEYNTSTGWSLITKRGLIKYLPKNKKSKILRDRNVIKVLQNLDQIYDYARVSANPAKTPSMLDALVEKPNCVAPTFVQDKLLPLVTDEVKKKRGQKHKSPGSPITWNQFINTYITSPKPKVERIGDSLDDAPFGEKLKMTLAQRAEQQKYFEKITRNPSNDSLKVFGKQLGLEKNSYSKSTSLFFEKENLDSVRARLTATADYQIKHHKLWNDILNKVCPTTIFGKVMECTLPPLECRELLKEFGIKRILPMIEQFESYDPRLRTVRKKWEKKREQNNVKAIKFTGRSYLQADTFPGGIHENLQKFSVSLWVRARSNDNKNGTHIFSHYRTRPDADRAFAIKVGKDRNIKVTFHGDGTYKNRKEIISTKRVFDSDWHHVLVTFDGPKNQIKIFINGKEDTKAKVIDNSDFTTIFNSDAPITFGCSGNKTKNYTGFLDEVVIFKKALNSANAKTLSDPKLVLSSNATLVKNAMHWWRMGADPRDNIDRGTNSYTRMNRIHDQLNDMHGTPKRFSRRASDIYEAHPFDDGMLDELVAIIEEVFDLEVFCQLLLLSLFNAFGIDIPKFGGPGGLPKLPTNNPFGALLKLLEEAVISLVVDMIMGIFMTLLEQLSVSCNDIGKILQGDIAGTEMGKFADNFGDLLDKVSTGDLGEIAKNPLAKDLLDTTADILKQTEDFMNETGQFLEDTIKNGLITKYKDPITGEERDYSSVLDGFDIVTPNEVEERRSGISSAWMENTDTDEPSSDSKERSSPSPREALREKIFCNPTKDLGSIMRDVASLVTPDEILRLLTGKASINTLEAIAKVVNTKYPHLSFLSDKPELFNEAFGMLGIFSGLDKLRDKVLSAADDLENLPEDSETTCFANADEELFNKKKFLKDIVQSKLSDEELEELARKAQEDRQKRLSNLLDMLPSSDKDKDPQEDEKCEKNIYDSVPEPEIIDEILARTIQTSISPIVMAYDADMLLYKPAMTEKGSGTRRVPKILWEGEEIQVTTFEDGKVASQKGKLEDTIINPEFRGMLSNGHIPMRKDGKIDGSEFGALLKTKWWAPWDSDWLSKKERISLGRDQDGEPLDDSAGVADLPGSLGPYTDYDEDNGGSAYAFKEIQKVTVAANVRRHLNRERMEINYFSGRSEFTFKARNFDDKSKKLFNKYNKTRKHLKREKARLKILKKKVNSQASFFGFTFGGDEDKQALETMQKHVDALRKRLRSQKKKYKKSVVSGSSNVEIYADKTFFGLDGTTENTIITKAAAMKGYVDPAPKLPTFNVTYANTFGTRLDNESLLSVRRFGKDAIQLNISNRNKIDPILENHLIFNELYDPSDCDDANGDTASNKYSSQENVFAHVIANKWKRKYGSGVNISDIKSELRNSIVDPEGEEDDTMGSSYDDIMKKVLIYLAMEVEETPLLSAIKGTKNSDTNESAIGVQFADFNPTESKPHKENGLDPRIMDFKSFVKQVSEDYKFFKDCKIGEINIDGKRNYKTPLSLALRAVHPYMVARLYSLEYLLQAVFPVIEFNAGLDVMTEKLLMSKIRHDMRKRPGYYKEFTDNTVEMQNLKAEYGLLDEEIAETFEEAFMPILRKEYAFALEKLRQVALKECSGDSTTLSDGANPERQADEDGVSDSEEEKTPPSIELKNILLDNVQMIDVKENRFSSLRVGLDKSQRRSLRRTKKAIRRARRLVGLTNKIIRDPNLDLYKRVEKATDNYLKNSLIGKTVTEFLDPEEERKKNLKKRRNRYKERQRRRRELLKNRYVRQRARYRNKKRIQMLERGNLFLERYIKDSSGKIIMKLPKNVNLNSSKHLLNSKVATYGIRLVYVELAEEQQKTTPDGDVITTDLTNLPSKDEAYVVGDSGFLSGFEYKGGTSHERYWMKDGDDYTIRNAKPVTTREKKLYVHPLAEYEMDADELLDLLGLSRDSDDSSASCFELEGFTGPGIHYTDSDLPDHYHEYEVDADGNGITTTVFAVNPSADDSDTEVSTTEVMDHTHEVMDFKIQPEIYVEGQEDLTKEQVDNINHVHEMIQESDEDLEENAEETVSGRVSRKIFTHLSQELRDTTDFRVMFEYCFNLQDVSSVVTSYAYLANSSRELLKMFDVTKRRLENYLFNASSGSNYFNSSTGCNEAQMAKSMFNMGNSNMDDLWNPSLLLFLLMTPLHIYKGWVKMADPHCLITQTIVALGQAGFLIPKLEKQNIEIPLTDPVQCQEILIPTFPGTKIGFPGFTQLVALAVTYAPLLVFLPPFPPTPFGLIYYLLVDPLLMLMSPWANEMMKNDPNLKRALGSAGLDLDKDVPLCLTGETTPIAKKKKKKKKKKSKDDDESCAALEPDPIDVGGYGKSNC